MKLDVLKKLIKEAVREAVREELGLILLEQKQTSLRENYTPGTYVSPTISMTSNDVVPINTGLRKSLKQEMEKQFGGPVLQQGGGIVGTSANPFAAFLEDSAETMTPQELSGLRNMG